MNVATLIQQLQECSSPNDEVFLIVEEVHPRGEMFSQGNFHRKGNRHGDGSKNWAVRDLCY